MGFNWTKIRQTKQGIEKLVSRFEKYKHFVGYYGYKYIF